MPAATAVSRLRCLVVDDHPVVRQGIRALLERELPDVEVSSVSSPEAAIEEVEPGSTDVIVIDLRRVTGDIQ
jgi:two-component system, NarL family, response regulator DevR